MCCHSEDHAAKAASSLEERIQIPVGITPETLSKYTLYDVLGLGNWADCCDMEVIKKAYHKAVLLYHPDKQPFKMANGQEDRTVFLKIQDAYNTLTSESKRRAYDSQLPFDESIPSDEQVKKALDKGPEKYLKMYDKVFKRNARFAVAKPVPEIGDMSTPIGDVHRFYDYWVKFDSWRDFTGVGAEHNPDDAGCRYEKRQYQKENEKLAKRLKMKEMDRIINLVTRAMAHDPRLLAEKEAKKAAKESEKRAREEAVAAKAKADAEARAWAEAEEKAAQEAAKASKADKEKLKKAQSKARNTMKKLLRSIAELDMTVIASTGSEYGSISEKDVEVLCAQCSLMELNEVNDAMGGETAIKEPTALKAEGLSAVRDMIARAQAAIDEAAEDERREAEARKQRLEESKKGAQSSSSSSDGAASSDSKGGERVWGREEMSCLAKAVKKYPAGSQNRWVSICGFMNDLLRPERKFDMDECLRAAHNAVQMMQKK